MFRLRFFSPNNSSVSRDSPIFYTAVSRDSPLFYTPASRDSAQRWIKSRRCLVQRRVKFMIFIVKSSANLRQARPDFRYAAWSLGTAGRQADRQTEG